MPQEITDTRKYAVQKTLPLQEILSPRLGSNSLSLVVPIFNEEESIPILFDRLLAVLKTVGCSFEIIAVNDGSTDRSDAELAKTAARHHEIKIIEFRRNAGQTAAIMAGIDHASGEIIVTIDADLQNDPRDIPLLLAKLAEGHDVVSGWRKDRQDAAIRRNLVSRIANQLISRISGVPLHDYGCTLKAYRKDVLQGMRLYGEMHRFVPIYASWMGARVVEIPVRHHARPFGKSKYGLNRTLKVVLDLLVVKFFSRYLVKPIYVFGGFGLCSILGGGAAVGYGLYLKFFEHTSLIQTPLPVLAAMLVLVGFVSIMIGLLAEIMVRTYFESKGQAAYSVRKLINFERAP
jgi:glycosyltransferase involved in cell wall biosynthesis